MKHKKSLLVVGTLVRIIVAIVLLFFVFAACNRIKSAFYDEATIYQISFEDFVNGLNDMSKPKERFEIKMDKKMAIIGFNKDESSWSFKIPAGVSSTILKPSEDAQCISTACVCLCRDGINKEGSNIECKRIYCKMLGKDIEGRTNVLAQDKYWEYGFLFVNDMEGINGLSKHSGKEMTLFVDLEGGIEGTVSVCNDEMLGYNIGQGIESCKNP